MVRTPDAETTHESITSPEDVEEGDTVNLSGHSTLPKSNLTVDEVDPDWADDQLDYESEVFVASLDRANSRDYCVRVTEYGSVTIPGHDGTWSSGHGIDAVVIREPEPDASLDEDDDFDGGDPPFEPGDVAVGDTVVVEYVSARAKGGTKTRKGEVTSVEHNYAFGELVGVTFDTGGENEHGHPTGIYTFGINRYRRPTLTSKGRQNQTLGGVVSADVFHADADDRDFRLRSDVSDAAELAGCHECGDPVFDPTGDVALCDGCERSYKRDEARADGGHEATDADVNLDPDADVDASLPDDPSCRVNVTGFVSLPGSVVDDGDVEAAVRQAVDDGDFYIDGHEVVEEPCDECGRLVPDPDAEVPLCPRCEDKKKQDLRPDGGYDGSTDADVREAVEAAEAHTDGGETKTSAVDHVDEGDRVGVEYEADDGRTKHFAGDVVSTTPARDDGRRYASIIIDADDDYFYRVMFNGAVHRRAGVRYTRTGLYADVTPKEAATDGGSLLNPDDRQKDDLIASTIAALEDGDRVSAWVDTGSMAALYEGTVASTGYADMGTTGGTHVVAVDLPDRRVTLRFTRIKPDPDEPAGAAPAVVDAVVFDPKVGDRYTVLAVESES